MVNPTFDPAFVQRDTASLLGPQTAGWQFGFILYGAYLVLHVQYITGPLYKKLATQVKVVIHAVFVTTLAYQVLAYIDNFHYMIEADRSPEWIILGWPVDFLSSLVAGIVAATVQTFLTIRASVLIRNRRYQMMFLLVMGVSILASFTGAILTTTTSFMYYDNTIENINLTFNQSVALWLWTAAFVDVSISISLLITLKQRMNGGGGRHANVETDSLVRKLIVVSLRTAAYTSVLAVAGAIVSLIFKDNNPAFALLHFAFWTPLPSCYAISLYTTLASRKTIDDHLGTVHPLSGIVDDEEEECSYIGSSSRRTVPPPHLNRPEATLQGLTRNYDWNVLRRPRGISTTTGSSIPSKKKHKNKRTTNSRTSLPIGGGGGGSYHHYHYSPTIFGVMSRDHQQPQEEQQQRRSSNATVFSPKLSSTPTNSKNEKVVGEEIGHGEEKKEINHQLDDGGRLTSTRLNYRGGQEEDEEPFDPNRVVYW